MRELERCDDRLRQLLNSFISMAGVREGPSGDGKRPSQPLGSLRRTHGTKKTMNQSYIRADRPRADDQEEVSGSEVWDKVSGIGAARVRTHPETKGPVQGSGF